MNPLFPNHKQKNGVYYLSDTAAFEAFEAAYLKVRERENRFYADEVIAQLPFTAKDHPYHAEWELRMPVIQKFLSYLKKHHPKGNVLEIGCGNAWLSAQIAKHCQGQIVGLDVNRPELEDGARVFAKHQHLALVFADIFEENILVNHHFDVIVLAGALQYFPDAKQLLQTLQHYLAPKGEIHIFDSPFYDEAQKKAAQLRSQAYYQKMGVAEMGESFHQHSLSVFADYELQVLYNPKQLKYQLARKLGKSVNPFPWLCV